MDVLWSPWRYSYIKSENASETRCVFCDLAPKEGDDKEKFVLYRGEHNFVILNIYPYISGHLMVVPFDHIGRLSEFEPDQSKEFFDLTIKTESVLEEVYEPHGINVGMNLGKAAGAGVDAHVHMHLLPRWVGDANFMTAIGQTRTVPESLETTYEKLIGYYS